MRTATFLLLAFCSCSVVWAEDPVHFPDENLEAAVENELWLWDPTPTDMLGLLSLKACSKGIHDLTGLHLATNATMLWMTHNEISDLSPLAGLTNLATLVLNNNPISDLSPISGLVNLRKLDCHENQLSDISCLSGLTDLRDIDLHMNRICDISALAGLRNLQRLILYSNDIVDISALTGLLTLQLLDLRGNPLDDTACELYIPQIIANNPGLEFRRDVCISRELSIASTIGGAVVAPGEGEFVCENGDVVRFLAETDPFFQFSCWSGSCFSTQNPMLLTIAQDYEIQANFTSTLDVIYVDDDADASDPQQNGTAEHPFASIQLAIAVAVDGAVIVVRPGVYSENVDLLGKSIQILGIDPNAASVPSSLPVIDGTGTGPAVTFVRGEDPNCSLVGFVITRGRSDSVAAILCSGSSPTVANCLIVGNCAEDSDGAIVRCIDSHAVFLNCTIADNGAGADGAAIYLSDSDVLLTNSIVWGHAGAGIMLAGTSDPLLTYCDIAGGWPGLGNIEVDPLFAQPGWWADPDDLSAMVDPGVDGAVWVEGDYHLRSQAGRWDPTTQVWVQDELTSPCIDAGDPTDPVGAEPVPNNGIINLGTYGGTSQGGTSE